MRNLPVRPVIYEVNTHLWLNEWRDRCGYPVELGNLPYGVWEDFKKSGVDVIWLMGVWQRSDLSRRLLWQVREVREAAPEGIVGSPYAVKSYEVDAEFGGEEGLRRTREVLAKLGICLILDFVPNHTAPDHPWTETHPEFYVSGEGLGPEESILCGSNLIAKGRDPFFPPWPDVVQLNAFHEGYRREAIRTLLKMGDICDGVRCDMAMLMLNDVFENTWGTRVKRRPREEFWSQVISAVKEKYPSFLFLAEVYWGREKDLLQLGFDYCYDKVFYDLLRQQRVESLRVHFSEPADYQDRLLRFLENHDEERAAQVFPREQLRAASVMAVTLPGALLYHHGQWEGRQVRVPIFAQKNPPEDTDSEILAFYRWLNSIRSLDLLRKGSWELLPPFGVWPDNRSGENLLAWLWASGKERLLVIVNYSPYPAQGMLPLLFLAERDGEELTLIDLATNETYPRFISELRSPGLFVALPPWGYHLFHFRYP